jgi:hypothetical protein
MEQSDANAPKLPQPKVLTDKFNRVIKTEEDFRIGMRRGVDGVNRWYRNGKLLREETPAPKRQKEDIVVVFRQEAIDTTTRKVFKSPTTATNSTGPTLGAPRR